MSTPSDAILEFVELAVTRRKRALVGDDRARIEALDEQLRDVIDGARPAPKHIEGRAVTPVAAQATPTKPSQPVPPAAVVLTPSAPPPGKGTNVKGLAEKLEISSMDKKKISDVNSEDLPVSLYTPPTAPAYLSDYYSDDILPFEYSSTAKPTGMVRADSGDLDVPKEVKVLFGLEKPAPVKVPTGDASSVTDPKKRIVAAAVAAKGGAAAAAQPRMQLDPETQSKRRPVIVHMLAGGTKRGALEAFDPASSAIDFFDDNGSEAHIELADVLAVFFVQRKGDEPSVPTGQRVIVRLVNDRQVAGLTEDYAEGGDSLTLTPEQRRGNVDRVWIPAWAVKEIHLG